MSKHRSDVRWVRRSAQKNSSRYGAGVTAVAAALKFEFKPVPTACTAAMMTIAMPAAIRPYSMAVAPESFFKKRETNFVIGGSRLKLHPERSRQHYVLCRRTPDNVEDAT